MSERYDVTDDSYMSQPPLYHKMLAGYIRASCL